MVVNWIRSLGHWIPSAICRSSTDTSTIHSFARLNHRATAVI